MKKSQRGFVALISVLVICGVVMTLLLGASAASFYARGDAFDYYAHEEARAEADACAEDALHRVSISDNPLGIHLAEYVVVLGDSEHGNALECVVENVVVRDAVVHVATHARYGLVMASTTVLATVFDTTQAPVPPGSEPFTILMWRRE